MANSRFVLNTDVWSSEYTELSLEEHGMYTLLCSQKMVSLCGVMHYSPKRLALLTRGATPESVERVVAALEALRYVVVDRDTDELIIRTFVKHSGCLNMPKVIIGMTRQFDQIASLKLRAVVLDQMVEALDDPTRNLDEKGFDKRFLEALECHRNTLHERVSERVSDTVCDTHPLTTDYGLPTTNHILVDVSPNVHPSSEPVVEDKPRPLAAVPSLANSTEVREVFAHWQQVMKSPNSVLDSAREGKLRWALKNWTVVECKQAIDGCAATPHNMGANDRATKFNGIKVIFRDADQVERFRAQRNPSKPVVAAGRWTDGTRPETLPTNDDIQSGRWVRTKSSFG
jgi:hypothetical protein